MIYSELSHAKKSKKKMQISGKYTKKRRLDQKKSAAHATLTHKALNINRLRF